MTKEPSTGLSHVDDQELRLVSASELQALLARSSMPSVMVAALIELVADGDLEVLTDDREQLFLRRVLYASKTAAEA